MKPHPRSLAPLAGLALWTSWALCALSIFCAIVLDLPRLTAQQPDSPASKKSTSTEDPSPESPAPSAPNTPSAPKPPGFSLGIPPQSPAFTPLPVGPSDTGRLPLFPPLPGPGNPGDLEPQKELGDLPDFELNKRRPDAPLPDGPNRTEEAALLRSQRIRYRETKAKALLIPEVQASLGATRKARSDRELREALRTHYDLLYSKMATLEPKLASLLETQRQRSMDVLKQTIGPEASQNPTPHSPNTLPSERALPSNSSNALSSQPDQP